jgi:hypothetical protein
MGTPASAGGASTVCASGCQYTNIQDALAAAPVGGTIKVRAGTYSGGLTITKDVTLVGAGHGQTTISGGGPVVDVPSGVTVMIRGLTISGGTAAPCGGGIVNAGTLLIAYSAVSGNSVGPFDGDCTRFDGGGIYNTGTLLVKQSTVSDNNAFGVGGGIYNAGALTLRYTALSGNTGNDGIGGSIFNTATLDIAQSNFTSGGNLVNVGTGTMTLRYTVLSGLSAFNSGGGIENLGTMKINQSALSGNTAPNGVGGGISNSGALAVNHSSVTGNTAGFGNGGGIENTGSLTLNDTNISGNVPGDCAGC